MYFRVLAPPGGGSSNIFGGYEDDSAKKNTHGNRQNVNKANNDIFGTGEQIATGTSPGKKHNPNNVNCGNNDIFNREAHAAPAQPKSRAPRSGDDSFHKLFGDSNCISPTEGQGSKVGPTNIGRDLGQDWVRKDTSQSKAQPRHSDSFANVFGNSEPGSLRTLESKSGRRGDRDDSFSNVFNHLKTPNDDAPLGADAELRVRSHMAKSCNNNTALHTSLNDLSLGGGEPFLEDDHDIDSSFSRVLGQYQANVTPKANRFSDRGGMTLLCLCLNNFESCWLCCAFSPGYAAIDASSHRRT